MTNKQTPDLALTEYGTRDNIAALSRRLQAMHPDAQDAATARALAQYAIALDANPFRGEVYAFTSRGKLVLVDGYKLLVRWAKRQMAYSERYERLTADELPDADAIGHRCSILRDDARATLTDLVQAGATFAEAFEIAATSAVGVVVKADHSNRQPPKGWTWDQVARKRALKNALNLSHGAPSPREIAQGSWIVDDVVTIPADWHECTPEMSTHERERLAKLHARDRERQAQPDERTPEEILEQNPLQAEDVEL